MYSYEKLKVRLEKYLNKYQYVVCISINKVKSKQIHDIRKFLRHQTSILVGKRSLISYYLKYDLKHLYENWQFLIKNTKGNIGMIFTDIDPVIINKVLNKFYLSAYASAGHRASKNIKIKKGIKPLSPSQTPFFQALGISTRISKGSIDIIDNLLFVKKDEIISISHIILLKKLDVKPFRYGMKIVKILKKKHEINLGYLNINRKQLKSNISYIIKMSSITDIRTVRFSKPYLSYNIYLINKNIHNFLFNNINY